MRRVIVAAIGIGLLLAEAARADRLLDIEAETERLTKETALLTERIRLLEQQRLLLDKQSQILELRKKITAASTPVRSVQLHVNWARIVSLADQSKFCNATPYVAYSCNGTSTNKCEFNVSKEVCGDPSQEVDPKVMKVEYSCGTEAKGVVQFPFGFKGYLTCN